MILERGKEITDLDVYALQFDDFLQSTRVAAECKGEESGFDSILRLRGVADYYIIDIPLIVRGSIATQLLEFIHSLGMLGMTTSHLSDLEDYRNISDSPYNGSLSEKADTNVEGHEKQLAAFDGTNELLWKHREAWMVLEPHQRFSFRQILHSEIETLWSKEPEGKLKHAIEWLMTENFILAAVAAVEIASELIDRPKMQRKQRITSELLGGDISYKEKKRIIGIVREIINATQLEIDPRAFQLEPEYVDRLNSFVGELLRNPQLCQGYIRFVDFTVHEFVLPRLKVDRNSLETSLGLKDAQLKTFSSWSQMLGRALSASASIPKPLAALM